MICRRCKRWVLLQRVFGILNTTHYSHSERTWSVCLPQSTSPNSQLWLSAAFPCQECPLAASGGCCSCPSPVHHGGDAFPGAEAGHALQLLVCDPGRNDDLLGVTATQPGGKGSKVRAWSSSTLPREHKAAPEEPDSSFVNSCFTGC